MPIRTIMSSARPIDLNNTRRNGGENIWVSALMAASNIGFLRAIAQRYVRFVV